MKKIWITHDILVVVVFSLHCLGQGNIIHYELQEGDLRSRTVLKNVLDGTCTPLNGHIQADFVLPFFFLTASCNCVRLRFRGGVHYSSMVFDFPIMNFTSSSTLFD